MKFGAKWSVNDIKPEARDTAREAARRSGMPLGDWLNSVILHTAAQQGVDPNAPHHDDSEDAAAVHSRLDDLTRRIDQLTRRGPEAYAPPQYRPAQYAPPPAYAPPPQVFAPPNFASRLDSAVAEIAARRRALNGEPTPQPVVQQAPLVQAPMLAPAMEPPPAIVRAPMPAQDLSGLEEQLRQITERIDTLRTPGVEEAIHALRGELAEIGNSLNAAMPRQAIDTIERQIHSLTARIAEGRQAGADNNALANVEHGLAEVRDALYQLTPAESLSGFGEAIHGLDQKIDYIVAQKDPATLQQLEESIVTLRQIAEHIASGEAVGRVASDVAMLAEKVDRLALAGPSGDALNGLEQRIAALSDAITARSQNGVAVPPKLEALVGSLSDKIEKLQGSRTDDVAFGHLEDRIVKLVEKLDASDSRLAHLEAIERGLGDLLVHIEEMRAQKPSGALRDSGNGAVDALKQDIARTQNEIQAVHGTLGQVVDRLVQIEQGMREPRDVPLAMPGKLAVRAVPAEPVAPPPVVSAPPVQPDIPAAPPAPVAKPEPAKRPLPRATSLPIDPDLPPDQPLEPGSGPPRVRLDPAARIAASEAALGGARPAGDAPQSKSGFIAAARRAAQAALKDKSARAEPTAQAPAAYTDDAEQGSVAKRLSKRVKSLFVAASMIAIVIGGVQIASTYLDLFQPTPKGTRLARATAPAKQPTADDVTASAGTPAAPAPSLTADLLQQTSPLAMIAPGTLGPAATSNLSALPLGDVTGALSSRQAKQPHTAAPSVAPPKTVPAEQIPVAIGSAKLREAAQRGDVAAAYEIAVRFADGRGVAANLPEAARWFERAAQQGSAPAQFRLGSLYEKGQGVKKDLGKARQNYLAAAAQGNGKAMHNLAVLYSEGLGDKPDFTTAAQWFQKAAARGIADSQYNLAVLYARGLGVTKSLPDSYKWFALAATHGDKEAARKRDDVAAQLDARELASAKHAVKAWAAVPQPPAAVNVPQPAGGWDEAAPAAPRETPKVRASNAPMKIGRR